MITSATNNSLEEQQRIFRELMIDLLPEDDNREVTDRIMIFRRSDASPVTHGESALALCMIAEGSKQVLLGDAVYRYDKDHYFVTSMQLPTSSYVIEATPDVPYLSVRLLLDPELVRSVLISGSTFEIGVEETSAFEVSETNAELIDAVVRLLRVWQHPVDAQVLAPLIEREIVYRLLRGNHGGRLAHIAGLGPTSTLR